MFAHRPTLRALMLTSLTVLLFAGFAQAEIKLPAIFSDGAVLQRNKPVKVWGWAAPNVDVTVSIKGKSAKSKSDNAGKWLVTLPAMAAAGGPVEIAIAASNGDKATVKDVLIGEVWVCSGQSNMEWAVNGAENGMKEIAAANYSQIRIIDVPNVPSETPAEDFQGKWMPCTPQTIAGFSAVGYFFGRRLYNELNVPIGLIGSNWGGTEVEPWTSAEGLAKEPQLKSHVDQWNANVAANAGLKLNPGRPTVLYNGMIAPLTNYAVAGAIWYQGESNVPRAFNYRYAFPAMIQSWRDAWGDKDLPVYFVQIAPFKYTTGIPQWKTTDTQLAELWDSQLHTLNNVKHTGMAVISDVGNVSDIHPRNKIVVGDRLALWALAKTYDKKVKVFSGPIYKEAKPDGGKVVVSFDHTGSGLTTRDGKPPTHFQVAGEDMAFKPAEATINGDKIVVESKEVAKPVAVRFGWHEAAEPNLMNKEGLPASPFRTDNWKLATQP